MEKYRPQKVRGENQEEKEAAVGTSLFDQIMAQRKLSHPHEDMFLLRRLVAVAALPEPPLADAAALGAHYKELNMRLQRQHQVESITGLLLIYPSCLLHVIESSSEVLVSALKSFQDMEENPDSLVKTQRILLLSHQIPNRLFQQWSYKELSTRAKTSSEEFEEDTVETLAATVLSQLLKLGNHPEISKQTLPGSVLDRTPELIVPQGVLERLLARGELLSPRRYLQAYHSPLDIAMDSGHVFGSSRLTTV